MSSNNIVKMYRTLDEEKCSWLNISLGECTASYKTIDNEQVRNLPLSQTGTTTENAYVIEGDDYWNGDESAITVKQEITLDNLNGLFLSDNETAIMPIALKGDKLGIAAVWWSDQSGLRGCEKIQSEITYESVQDNHKQKFSFIKNFDYGMLSGTLTVKYVLYLKDTGELDKPGYARKTGTVLGEIGMPLIIMIDGDGASFPLNTIKKPGAPLWWVEINIDDPYENRFVEEYFNIILNESHPDFKDFAKDKGYQSALYREVFAGALEELIIYLWMEKMEFNEDIKLLLPGTVAYAVIYLVQTFGIETDTITNIHRTVRQAVEKQLKEAYA